MLTVREPCPDARRKAVSRRSFLRLGALTLGGLTLDRVPRLRAEAPAGPRPKSDILIHLSGGPSHLDMYDMKPNAVL